MRARRRKNGNAMSYLALEIDATERSSLGGFQRSASLASSEPNITVPFALDESFTAMIADELEALTGSGVRVCRIIVFFTNEREFVGEELKTDIGLVSAHHVSNV